MQAFKKFFFDTAIPYLIWFAIIIFACWLEFSGYHRNSTPTRNTGQVCTKQKESSPDCRHRNNLKTTEFNPTEQTHEPKPKRHHQQHQRKPLQK